MQARRPQRNLKLRANDEKKSTPRNRHYGWLAEVQQGQGEIKSTQAPTQVPAWNRGPAGDTKVPEEH